MLADELTLCQQKGFTDASLTGTIFSKVDQLSSLLGCDVEALKIDESELQRFDAAAL